MGKEHLAIFVSVLLIIFIGIVVFVMMRREEEYISEIANDIEE